MIGSADVRSPTLGSTIVESMTGSTGLVGSMTAGKFAIGSTRVGEPTTVGTDGNDGTITEPASVPQYG